MFLQTLLYSNTAEEPIPDTRLIEITVNDGHTDSDAMLIYISMKLTNDAPKVIDYTYFSLFGTKLIL